MKFHCKSGSNKYYDYMVLSCTFVFNILTPKTYFDICIDAALDLQFAWKCF